MTQTELEFTKLGLDFSKLRGENNAMEREITYLRSALEAKQNFIKPDVSGQREQLIAFLRQQTTLKYITIYENDFEFADKLLKAINCH